MSLIPSNEEVQERKRQRTEGASSSFSSAIWAMHERKERILSGWLKKEYEEMAMFREVYYNRPRVQHYFFFHGNTQNFTITWINEDEMELVCSLGRFVCRARGALWEMTTKSSTLSPLVAGLWLPGVDGHLCQRANLEDEVYLLTMQGLAMQAYKGTYKTEVKKLLTLAYNRTMVEKTQRIPSRPSSIASFFAHCAFEPRLIPTILSYL